MKIMFYISTIQGGGAARVMVNLANAFYKSGEQIHFVMNFTAEHDYELCKGIERYVLDNNTRAKKYLHRTINRIVGLRKLIKSIKPDICVSFMDDKH